MKLPLTKERNIVGRGDVGEKIGVDIFIRNFVNYPVELCIEYESTVWGGCDLMRQLSKYM
jgi:hypothetical protein